MLSRLWIRQLSKLCLACLLVVLVIIGCDIYLDILPNRLQNRLPDLISYHQSHPAWVITDIVADQCGTPSKCANKQGSLGHWLNRQLNLGSWASYVSKSYLFVNGTTSTGHHGAVDELEVIVDIIVRDTSTSDKNANLTAWTSVRGTNIWVKKEPFDSRSTRVTGIDVLYGDQAVEPRPGWEVLGGCVMDGVEIKPKLSVKRSTGDGTEGSVTDDKKTGSEGHSSQEDAEKSHKTSTAGKRNKIVLRANNSKFKILQVADLHFVAGPGKCLESVGDMAFKVSMTPSLSADTGTLKFIDSVLDIEKPDMVVMSGDQVYGSDARDTQTALFKAIYPFEKRGIPYAIIWGNHDDEGPLDRQAVSDLLHGLTTSGQLPHSLYDAGPDDVDGYGNYLVLINGPKSNYPAITLYLMDSHTRQNTKSGNPPYIPLRDSQLDFLRAQHSRVTGLQKGYSHIPLSMAFMHVPFPEFRSVGAIVGTVGEGVAGPPNGDTRDVLSKIGVTVTAVGHDHLNDFCGVSADGPSPMWLCYAGAVGEGGYGAAMRRLRIYEFDTQNGQISTWKRLHDSPGEKLDEQVLIEGGSVKE